MSDTPPGFVTISDLMKAAGVSRRTIVRWCEAGLLPAPTKWAAPDGRGMRGLYPTRAVARAREIRKQRNAGQPLEAIASWDRHNKKRERTTK